jgi:multiple antibiotic resistance protein
MRKSNFMLLPKVCKYKNEFLAQSIMLEQALKFFIVFFVVVEPLSLIPVFSGLTEGANASYRHKMALKSVLVASGIILLFAVVGAGFLKAMGIAIDSFRIFGGLLLFLIALEMVFARESGTRTSSDEKVESRKRADISVFPLAFPFMAGPGALTTILLWFGPIPVTQQPLQFLLMFACAVLVLACCLFAMWVAGPLMNIMGVTGTNVANRLFGVVLGALAVQFVVDGVRVSFAL